MKHCTLQSDMGYTNIVLELYGVHDRESDRYMNLIIYLLYHSNEARPHKINIDTMEKNKLNNDLKQRLKVCLNEFKISDLSTAFDKISSEDSAFTWMRASDSDSPLELNVQYLNKYKILNKNFIIRIHFIVIFYFSGY